MTKPAIHPMHYLPPAIFALFGALIIGIEMIRPEGWGTFWTAVGAGFVLYGAYGFRLVAQLRRATKNYSRTT